MFTLTQREKEKKNSRPLMPTRVLTKTRSWCAEMSISTLYPCFLFRSFFISPCSPSLPLSPCVMADWAVGSVVGRSEDAAVHINNAESQLPPSTVAMAPAHRCHQGGAGNAPLLSLLLYLFFLSLSLTHGHIFLHVFEPRQTEPPPEI